MCGICGFYGFEDKELLKELTKTIEHRGPDQEGYFSDKNCSLGHRRLSIIDLSEKGRQPIHNEEKDIWITFNGEIYNYQEIKIILEEKGHRFYTGTDTEVIVHAYEEYGTDCVKKLNGMFAFAIWDSKKENLFLSRDRIGEKPLYYFYNKGMLIFSSELKSLLKSPQVKKQINKQALDNYLNLRFVPGPETIIKGIFKLQPGHNLIVNKKGLKIEKYWALEMNPINKDKEYFAKELLSVLDDSTKKRMMSDVPIGAYLSGGIDSSSVVAFMAKHSEKPVHTFSVTFTEEEKDLKYARLVAEKFNTDHKEISVQMDAFKHLKKIVWHMDEPFGDPAAIPTYLLAKETKRYATVVLTGDGPDELFAGYEQFRFMNIFHTYNKTIPSIIGKKLIPSIIKSIPKKTLNQFFKYTESLGEEGIKRVETILEDTNDPAHIYFNLVSVFTQEEKNNLYKNKEEIVIENTRKEFEKYFNEKKTRLDRLNAMLYYDLKVTLPDDFLMKVDKNTMAFAIEARTPFLDHRIIELASKIPPKYKMNFIQEKYILKYAMKEILPKEIIQRKKDRFFVPIDEWMLTKEVKDYAYETITKSPLSKDLINKEYINKITTNFKSSKLYYGRQLWNLLNLSLWHETFLEDTKE
ncbi:MAG: asparagine synthase (glutamine-hydrolyzing) [bacterium]|nr:asparagine synthase (glutamine-hydrolyzing) [bacterium]